MKKGERRARILAVLVIAAVAACFTLVPVEAHAAADTITIGKTSYTVESAAFPSLQIGYNASKTDYVYLDEMTDGLWVNVGDDYPSGGSGIIDVFEDLGKYYHDPHPAGTFNYRLRQGDITNPTVQTAVFTVTYNKTQPVLDIGTTTKHTGIFYTSDSMYSDSNTLYYYIEDKPVNLTWITGRGQNGTFIVQRLNGSKWVNVETITKYQDNTMATQTYKLDVKQYTSGTKSYRLYCPETVYTKAATSAVFTITGKKQSPGLSVKYSKKSQKRGSSSRVRLTILTKEAYSGKAVVYDGSKKLKTLTIKYGFIKGKTSYKSYYYLPKTLKKGTHKISVKFTATSVFKPFYKTQTSKVTKIKVK
jgi:hypothetical protein